MNAQKQNKEKYDAIVMGSGLGGLVSALVLAKSGKKVAILEKNNQYGGNLQTFVRNKHIFDTGVHYIGGLEEGQNLHTYFQYLGIMEEISLLRMDENHYDYITFDSDPIAYPHAQGYENFVQQLLRYFPEEEIALRRYVKEIQRVCRFFPQYSFQESVGYKEEDLEQSVGDFFRKLSSNVKLNAVLCGSSFLYGGDIEKTPFYIHALSVNSYIESAHKCIRGGSQITKALIKQLRKYGAELYKHTEITSIAFCENQKIESVQTSDGKSFFADYFISNIDIQQTIKLVGIDKFRKAYTHRILSLTPTISCFSLYIILKPKTLFYFNHNFYHYKNIESLFLSPEYPQDTWGENYMLSATRDEKNPEYCESLTMLCYTKIEDFSLWENTKNTVSNPQDRGSQYEKLKEEKAEKLIQSLEKKIPQIRKYIHGYYTSSPLSYRDYIGGTNGALYGYKKDYSKLQATFISGKTKISNLFLTGQTVNLHGVLGVTIGAFKTCSLLLGDDYINQELNSLILQK